MRVLVACEYSGVVRNAFIRKGHDAISCDLLPTESPGPHYQGSILDAFSEGGYFMENDGVTPQHFDLLIAHPPCTRLTNSGVRWLWEPPKGKTIEQIEQELVEGIEFYDKIRKLPIKRKGIENPQMHMYAKICLGLDDKSRQVVQPWWFGDKAFKATGFELIGLPELVPTNKLNPPKKGTKEYKEWSAIHYASPGPDRWKVRSRTFNGIAEAMAEQWGCLDGIAT